MDYFQLRGLTCYVYYGYHVRCHKLSDQLKLLFIRAQVFSSKAKLAKGHCNFALFVVGHS